MYSTGGAIRHGSGQAWSCSTWQLKQGGLATKPSSFCRGLAHRNTAGTTVHNTSGRSTSSGSNHSSTVKDISGSVKPPQALARVLAAPAAPSQQGTGAHRHALRSLLPGASHTCIQLSNSNVDLYGNYTIQGPASIRKVNDALFAVVHPGGAIQVLAADGPTGRAAEMSQDDSSCSTTCNLLGRYVELCGAYSLPQGTGTMHDDKLVVNVGRMPEEATITLLPGGTLSHPVVVSPHRSRPRN